jgi:hypothetical protein
MFWSLRMLVCCILWLEIIPGFILVKDLIQGTGCASHSDHNTNKEQATLTYQLNWLDTKLKEHWHWKGGELVVRGVLWYKWSNKNETKLFKMQHSVLCYPVFRDIQWKPLIMITLGPALFDGNYRLITLSEGYKNFHYLTQFTVTFYMYKDNKIHFKNLCNVACCLFAFSSSWMNCSYS